MNSHLKDRKWINHTFPINHYFDFYILPNFRYKKTAIKRLIVQVGALREIRTPDPLVRSQVLYPAEL